MAKKKKTAPKVAIKEPTPEVKSTEPVEVVSKKVVEYVVADGLSITSLRGMLKPGEVVTARDFRGGEATFTELVQKKHVVKSKK